MKFQLKGCTFQVSFSFLVVVALFLLLDRTSAAVYGILASVLHELGHVVMMFWKHAAPKTVVFAPFRVDILDHCRQRHSYRTDVAILLAGPCTNFVCFGFTQLCYSLLGVDRFLLFGYISLLVGVFNILPVGPLDGGQVLFALLAPKLGVKKAGILVQVVSFVVLLPVAFVGFVLLLDSRYNFSLLFLSCYLMLVLLLQKDIYP